MYVLRDPSPCRIITAAETAFTESDSNFTSTCPRRYTSSRAPPPDTDCLVAGEPTRRRDSSAAGGSRDSTAMAVGVLDAPLPPPICRPASCHAASSPPSLPSGATAATSPPALSMDEFNEKFFEEYGCDLTELLFTEEEVRVLMLEYEAEKAHLLSHGEVKETAPAEQVPDAPRPSKKARGENGKAAAAENVEVQTPPPPLVADAPRHSKKRKAPPPPSPPREEEAEDAVFQTTPPPSHKKVAERILNRRFFPPDPSHGGTILWCLCRELLPRGGPRCALHQKAPFRSWMSEQGYVEEAGGAGGWALVPKLSAECGRSLFQRYARWRRRAWMPTRFFLETTQPPTRT